MKAQGIAVPFAFEAVLSGKPVGGSLHQRFCLRDRQRMGSYEVNIGHTVSWNVSVDCLLLDSGIAAGTSLFLVPCGLFADPHFLFMPLHEDAVAMVEGTAPKWQETAIFIKNQRRDRGCGERQWRQLSQVCPVACQVTNGLVDSLHAT